MPPVVTSVANIKQFCLTDDNVQLTLSFLLPHQLINAQMVSRQFRQASLRRQVILKWNTKNRRFHESMVNAFVRPWIDNKELRVKPFRFRHIQELVLGSGTSDCDQVLGQLKQLKSLKVVGRGWRCLEFFADELPLEALQVTGIDSYYSHPANLEYNAEIDAWTPFCDVCEEDICNNNWSHRWGRSWSSSRFGGIIRTKLKCEKGIYWTLKELRVSELCFSRDTLKELAKMYNLRVLEVHHVRWPQNDDFVFEEGDHLDKILSDLWMPSLYRLTLNATDHMRVVSMPSYTSTKFRMKCFAVQFFLFFC